MKRLSQDLLVSLAANTFISAKGRSRTLHCFLPNTQIKVKDIHHTCSRYNTNDISWLHHLRRRGPFHISLPTSGMDFPAVWKEMLSPCYQSRMFPQQAMTWGVQLPPLPKGSQLCPQHRAVQTSQVSFSFMEEDTKSCWESPAQLTLAQGSKSAEVLSPAPDSRDCWVSASCEFAKESQSGRGTSGCFCLFCFAVF